MSRKPCVAMRPTVAPLASSMVLVAMVEPCTNKAQGSRSSRTDRPRSVPSRSSAAITPRLGSIGTEGTLATHVAPWASASTRSVNVPPTSTPIRQGGVGRRDPMGRDNVTLASGRGRPAQSGLPSPVDPSMSVPRPATAIPGLSATPSPWHRCAVPASPTADFWTVGSFAPTHAGRMIGLCPGNGATHHRNDVEADPRQSRSHQSAGGLTLRNPRQ